MPLDFHARSTTDEVLAGHDLAGKRVLVTGVSAGLGVETVRALVAHGATVVGTARDLAKARRATAQVADLAGDRFELAALDLADLASVRRAADALVEAGHPFDVVIANAGVMATPFGRTVDGFETQFGTNVLGHFVLVCRTAPLLRNGSRVVMLTSSGHRFADVDLADPNFERTPYEPWMAYGRSKTADALLAVAFDRRFRDRGIRAASVHPGGIRTELTRHVDESEIEARINDINRRRAEAGKPPYALKTVRQGAATTVWAGFVADADRIGGRYCENCGVSPVVPVDTPLDPVDGGVFAYALDPDRAASLWSLAETMTGERV